MQFLGSVINSKLKTLNVIGNEGVGPCASRIFLGGCPLCWNWAYGITPKVNIILNLLNNLTNTNELPNLSILPGSPEAKLNPKLGTVPFQ